MASKHDAKKARESYFAMQKNVARSKGEAFWMQKPKQPTIAPKPKKPKPVTRPSFIVSTKDVPETSHPYPERPDEQMAGGRAIGKAAGLRAIGLHVVRVEPGQRTSFPHAESTEEEFAFVLEGELDAWIDGHLHRVRKGDLIAFPAGTGICHTFLNNGTAAAQLFVGGDVPKADNRIYYPLAPEIKKRRDDWWDDVPVGEQGGHDGVPKAQRKAR